MPSSSEEDFTDEEFDLEALLDAGAFLSDDSEASDKECKKDGNRDFITLDLKPISTNAEKNKVPLDSVENLSKEFQASFIDAVTPIEDEFFGACDHASALRRRIMARRRLNIDSNPDKGEYTFAVCQRTNPENFPPFVSPEMSAQTPYNQLPNKRRAPVSKRRTPVQENWNRRTPNFTTTEEPQATEESELVVHPSPACELINLPHSDSE